MDNIQTSTALSPTRILQITNDGSHTLQLQDSEITYHSRFGAIQESEHVYLTAGLQPFIFTTSTIRIFEMGFGTGLLAFLSYLEAKENNVKIEYETVEAFPLSKEEYAPLNYAKALGKREMAESFQLLHKVPWNKMVRIGEWFTLTKHHKPVEQFETDKKFHVIFYDAFMPAAQPELWTTERFAQMFDMLLPNGVLATYCSKGEVRRNLEAVGFLVEKLQGPKGKREMLRAYKPA